MNRLYISAAHKSSGKTTLSIGLCAALRGRGRRVQPFKKGPDYIDPLWLSKASERPCYNLDFNVDNEAGIVQLFGEKSSASDISLIEGNKGLYDGVAVDGSDSNAAMAKLLSAPVILVLDTRGITLGVAPLLTGYLGFDRQVNIAGVILNQTAGPRHESKLRAAVERYTDLPVIGAVRRNPAMEIVERHLGLIPSNEENEAQGIIQRLRQMTLDQVDMNEVERIADATPALDKFASITPASNAQASGVRIGIARDEAFGFYYPDDLEAFGSAGATLVPVDLIRDRALPAIDGLFIGGGFPETHMRELEENSGMRDSVRRFVEAERPVYAECGGLMYLARGISWNGEARSMAGALPCDIAMQEKPRGRGYVRLRETPDMPWPGRGGDSFNAHEFHYSTATNLGDGLRFAFRVIRGYGVDGEHDGMIYKNTLACYSHQRQAGDVRWVDRFVGFVREKSFEGR